MTTTWASCRPRRSQARPRLPEPAPGCWELFSRRVCTAWAAHLQDTRLKTAATAGPDSRGIKTTTEYKRNDKGDMVKVTTRVKIVKMDKKQYEARPAHTGAAFSTLREPAHMQPAGAACARRHLHCTCPNKCM